MDDLFDILADVVVVGGGAGGFAAALAAADGGASVVLLEKSGEVGGTTALSGGTAWIPNNHLMRAEGLEDPRDDALRFMCRTAYPHRYDPTSETFGLDPDDFDLIARFYDEGPNAIELLSELGALDVEFDGTTPDYYSHLPEDAAPLGRRVPQRRVPGSDPHVMGGVALFERFSAAAERKGVRILVNHQATEVLRNDDGEVFGLEVRTGLRTELVRAKKGVVFATGGFLHSVELADRYLPGRVFGGCAAPSSTGDFLKIAQSAGAQMGPMDRAWWKQVVVEQSLRSRMAGSLFMAFGDSMVFVNKDGQRVVNEKAPYHERGKVHLQWSTRDLDYPNLLLFMIWDSAVADHPQSTRRAPVPEPGEHLPHVISGETWADLAAAISDRLVTLRSETGGVELSKSFLDNLEASIDRFNGFAERGVDEDFARGRGAIEVAWHSPVRPESQNPTMAPFQDTGPYYCAILGAGALDTSAGPRIDVDARVLGAGDAPIPGLYGAGNCVSSITGQAYWGPGGTIGPALTFGVLAGRHAASSAEITVSLGDM